MADYAISNVPRRVVYAASGTGPYAFTFEILAASDIAVYKGDTLLTLTTDYTVTINANGTGSVTLTATAGTSQITIVGAKNIQRTTDFTTGGDFFANTLNDELDAQTIFIQQVGETAERGLKAPVTDPTDINMVLPRKASRAGKTLAFDANGNPVVGEDIGNWRGNWAASTAYTVRDLVKDASNYNVYRCNTAHTSRNTTPISSNADSAKWDLVIDASYSAGQAANAAASATDSAASAALANDWATKTSGTVAGGEYSAKYHATAAASSASTASTKASEASTSASSASTSASTATTKASDAATSATAAASSATSASGSASTATTKAAEASSSASAASSSASAASTSATNASNSATSASTSATNAASSATTASTQATNAATSATNAASSATAAQTAQTAAEAAYDSFDDRYLGAKTGNPTVDNDGNALLTGALYFNSVAMTMRVYNGSSWQDQAASPDTMSERSFLATAGQTSYTFTGGYRVGYTYVYVNGALLYPDDITATNGTTITFTNALALNDEVRILSIKAAGTVAIADISGLQTALDGKATAAQGTKADSALQPAAIGVSVQAYDADLTTLGAGGSSARSFLGLAIGTDVQAYDANTAKTNANQSFSVAQRGTISALGNSSGTITLNMNNANNFSMTLNANSTNTLANPTNLTAGQSGVIAITQDATGSRTLAYGTYWKFPGGTAPTLTTTANAVDVLAYYVESSTRITARLVSDVK